MVSNSSKAAGEAAYAKADAKLGIRNKPGGKAQSGAWRSLPGVSWLLEGRMPSLWFLARLQFGLGLLTLIGEVLATLIGMLVLLSWTVAFSENTAFKFQVWTVALPGLLTFSVAVALFLLGAAVTSYFAARNDREIGQEVVDASNNLPAEEEPAAPDKPVEGIVPSVDAEEYESREHEDE